VLNVCTDYRMQSKKSKVGGTVVESRSVQQPRIVTPKKKRVTVDQYTKNRSLLDEIPMQMPRKGEKILRPDALPTGVEQKASNKFHCEVCDLVCSSFTTLKQHQAGRTHRKHVLIRAINSNRFLFLPDTEF